MPVGSNSGPGKSHRRKVAGESQHSKRKMSTEKGNRVKINNDINSKSNKKRPSECFVDWLHNDAQARDKTGRLVMLDDIVQRICGVGAAADRWKEMGCNKVEKRQWQGYRAAEIGACFCKAGASSAREPK